MSAVGAASPAAAPDVAPLAARWAEYDTTYLQECLAAWRALAWDCAQAAELEAELRERGEMVRG